MNNRTDQEWFKLIKDRKTSSLKVKTWCEQHWITIPVAFARITIRSRKKSHRLFRMKSMKSSAWIFHKVYPAQKQRLLLFPHCIMINMVSYCFICGWMPGVFNGRAVRPKHGCFLAGIPVAEGSRKKEEHPMAEHTEDLIGLL